MFNRIEQAFAAASGHEAMIKVLDERIASMSTKDGPSSVATLGRAGEPGNLTEFSDPNTNAEYDLVYMATRNKTVMMNMVMTIRVAHSHSGMTSTSKRRFEHRARTG